MNLKLLMLMIAVSCLFQKGLGQNQITGQVKDSKTGESLIGASVYVADLKRGVSTDGQGGFVIGSLKAGNYLLEISYVGYKSDILRIGISRDTTLSIVLDPSVSELNEVIVTAVTRSMELKKSPVIIKAIDKNSINQNSSTNLIDALKNVPGINQISTGASISKPVIRGLGYNRVISLYNGIRQEGQQWGDEHGIEIDEFDIDRIEIVKGPGSLIYGSDGIAGVLNFLSPKAPHLGEVKSQVVTNYQTNNGLVGYSLSNAGNLHGMQWLGRFSSKYAGNYNNQNDGKVYNSGFKEYAGSLFLGVNKNWGHSHFHFSNYNTILNLVEGERDVQGSFVFTSFDGSQQVATGEDLRGYKTGFPHQEVSHLRFSLSNYFILNRGAIHADFAFQNNRRREFADVTVPQDIALFFDLNTFNYNLRYNLIEHNGWETSFGFGGMQQSNFNRGLEFLIPEYHLFDAGIFGFTQKSIRETLMFSGGIRFDNRSMNSKELILDSLGMPVNVAHAGTELKFGPFKSNYLGLSGSLGLSYQIDKESTLKFNLSRGFRAPTTAELASNGQHEGTFRYEIGSPDLKSEVNHQIDLGYFLDAEHITLELTPFANFISNYIYTEKLKDAFGNDVIPDPDDPSPAFQFTQGDARLLGGEFYLDVHPHPFDWFHIANSFSFVQASQNNQSDSTKYLPFIPAPKYSGELKAEFKKVGKMMTNAYIKFGLDYFFQQRRIFRAYDTETETPAYSLLSAGVGANVRAFERDDFISIYVSVENLADVAYQSHLSRLKYAPDNLASGRTGVYNMGRNVSMKLIMNF